MRSATVFVFLVCLSCVLASAQAPATTSDATAELASIEGRVVNALTGQPVRNVNLMLTLAASGGGSVGARPAQSQNVSAVSDAEGKFKLVNLNPGRYTLSSEKTGYLRQQYGGRAGQPGVGSPLTVDPGQGIKDLEFKLMPQAIISGRVLNEDGEPLARANIQVQRLTGYFRRTTGVTGASTNDVGQFLIGNLTSGKYIIQADYRGTMFNGASPPQMANQEAAETFLSTFYPSAADADAAVPVAINPGQEVSGIDIWLRKGRVYSVRGKVLGVAADDSTSVRVALVPQKSPNGRMMGFGGGPNIKPDGSFEIPSVPPGSYFLIVSSFSNKGGGQQSVGRVPVTITSGNVDGVTIQANIAARIEVSGRVRVEGDETAKVAGAVMLQSAEDLPVLPGAPPARIQDDGTFKFASIGRDKYYITVPAALQGDYLKSVRSGDAEVLETGLDLSESASTPPLEIVFSPKAATIEGVVHDGDKPGANATITLLPEPMRPDLLRRLQRSTTSDQSGKFSLKSIAPGEYRLYAWNEPVSLVDIDPEDLNAYEAYAVSIKVGEEAREQVEVKLAKPPEQ